jgi:DeoR/GlpR family transcriptional regulator of sugar metabolism
MLQFGHSMNTQLRKDEIFEYVKEKRVSSIEELQEKFSLSLSTLHRDLNILQKEGRINKFYGKVAITVEQNFFNARKNINVELKKRIAKKALEFVNEGDCIFFDNSTTVYYLADVLCNCSKKNIVVVSNSAFISELFLSNKNINYVSTGGILNKELNCYVGPHAVSVINDFNANKFFLSCSGISVEASVSDIYIPDEQVLKLKMHEKSKESYLLADSSKIGKTSVIKWFELCDMDCIVTDAHMPSVDEGLSRLLEECDVAIADC